MAAQAIELLKKLFHRHTGIPPYRVRQILLNHIRNIYDFIRYKKRPMFRRVLIETSSFCNRRCKTCPVSQHPREKDYLDDKIFEDIVSELADIGFSGEVGLHFFDEPLANPTIVKKVRLLHERVPNATLYINSNGDYLTAELLNDLVSGGLSRLLVTQYDGRVHSHIQQILEEIGCGQNGVLQVRVKSDFDCNRGGSLNTRILSEAIIADCYLPSNQIVINFKGEVVICCNDYYSKVVLGKVGDNSMMDIWTSPAFQRVRRLLKDKKRSQIELCKGCNFLGDIYSAWFLEEKEVAVFNKKIMSLRKKLWFLPKLYFNNLHPFVLKSLRYYDRKDKRSEDEWIS